MHNRNSTTEANDARSSRAPSHCPGCGSTEVKTSSKVITADCYWRCERCGEVWNAGRRSTIVRSGGPFRR
jgi:ribosomal protein L37AE/L43A